MNITVQDIYNLNEGLSEVNDKELPISTAYKLQKNSLKVMGEYDVASGLRRKIIDKYKDKKLENGNARIKKEKIEEFNKVMEELMNQEVKLSLDKVELSELNSITVKPKTLIMLEKILKEDGQDDNRDKK